MIAPADLRNLAAEKLLDAQILFDNQRYDGAVYICGYAVELSLKARICDTLHWSGYPETKGEFAGLVSFKVHALEVLLHLSGIEATIKQNYLADWSIVTRWDPEARYKPVGQISTNDAQSFLQATGTLMQHL